MNILTRLGKCRTIVIDIDGVLTDGSLLVMEGGVCLRQMNVKDGYAIQLAVKKQYNIIVISGAENEHSKARLSKLGVTHIHTQIKDKAQLLKEIAQANQIILPEAVYIGDDNPDLAPMQLCGVRACPADASIDVQMMADYISPLAGGKGCVRDILEKMMRINGDWE